MGSDVAGAERRGHAHRGAGDKHTTRGTDEWCSLGSGVLNPRSRSRHGSATAYQAQAVPDSNGDERTIGDFRTKVTDVGIVYSLGFGDVVGSKIAESVVPVEGTVGTLDG